MAAHQEDAAKPPLKAQTGCVICMNETLSRKENGAVGGGSADLILPVRVRTCAEDVGRTGECRTGSRGMQPGRASTGRDGEASQRYFAGRRAGRSEVRASTLWAKHGIESRLDLPEGVDAVIPSGFSGAWRCHAGKMAIHSDQMKSHVVPTRFWRRASVLYKAMPKGRVMRRICEAVSGSTDLWDGSRAVVGSSVVLKVRNAKPFEVSTPFSCGHGKVSGSG